MKNEKTLLALRKKAGLTYGETARMPNLNKVAELLKEIGVECNVTLELYEVRRREVVDTSPMVELVITMGID